MCVCVCVCVSVCVLQSKGGRRARPEVRDFQGAPDQLPVQRLRRQSEHSHVEPGHRGYCAHDKSRVHRSGRFVTACVTAFRGLRIVALRVCVFFFLFFFRERVDAAHNTAQAPPEASNYNQTLFLGAELDRDCLARSCVQRHLSLLVVVSRAFFFFFSHVITINIKKFWVTFHCRLLCCSCYY